MRSEQTQPGCILVFASAAIASTAGEDMQRLTACFFGFASARGALSVNENVQGLNAECGLLNAECFALSYLTDASLRQGA